MRVKGQLCPPLLGRRWLLLHLRINERVLNYYIVPAYLLRHSQGQLTSYGQENSSRGR
jgi:hypothetical protein